MDSFWHHAGTHEFHPKCCGPDFGSRIKISGHLLVQNAQNFEIYPFRLVLGNQKGLAAEVEALRYNCMRESARTHACTCEQQSGQDGWKSWHHMKQIAQASTPICSCFAAAASSRAEAACASRFLGSMHSWTSTTRSQNSIGDQVFVQSG